MYSISGVADYSLNVRGIAGRGDGSSIVTVSGAGSGTSVGGTVLTNWQTDYADGFVVRLDGDGDVTSATRVSTQGGVVSLNDVAITPAGDAVVVGTTSAGTESTPISISDPGAGAPQVVVDGAGVSTVVWQDNLSGLTSRIMATRCAAGVCSTPAVVSVGAVRAQNPAVVVDGAGVVTVIWGEAQDGYANPNCAMLAARFRDGAWSVPETITSGAYSSDSSARAVLDATGVITAVWQSRATKVVAARGNRDGSWTTTQLDTGRDPDVAVDGAGTVTAVWIHGASYAGIGYSRFSGGHWGSDSDGVIDASAAGAYDPYVVASPSGIAVATWSTGSDVLVTSAYASGWSGTSVLEPYYSSDSAYTRAPLAIDSAGVVTSAWQATVPEDPSTPASSHASRFEAGATPSASAFTLADANDSLAYPGVFANPAGAATAIWSRADNTLLTRQFEAGRWGGTTALPTGVNADAPDAAVDAHGMVTLAWGINDLGAGGIGILRYVVSPDPPTAVSATAGDRSAVVSWTAPVYDGGAGLTSYTATASPGGAVCHATAPATSCTVSGLAAGTAYTFAVTATNGHETSAASAASAAVTIESAPSAQSAEIPSVKRLRASFTVRNGAATATFAKVPGASRYTIAAQRSLRAGASTKGRCVVKGKRVICSVRLRPGRWVTTVTASSKTAVLARSSKTLTVAARPAPRPGVAG